MGTIKGIIKIEDVILTYVTFVLQISFPQPRRWHVSDMFGNYTEDSLSKHRPINIINNLVGVQLYCIISLCFDQAMTVINYI